jgi:hypothetical protein
MTITKNRTDNLRFSFPLSTMVYALPEQRAMVMLILTRYGSSSNKSGVGENQTDEGMAEHA